MLQESQTSKPNQQQNEEKTTVKYGQLTVKENNYVLQESQTSKPNQQQNEEKNNREIRTINREIRKTLEHKNFNRLFRNHQPKQPPETESTRRRGNVECRGQTISHRLNYFRQRVA